MNVKWIFVGLLIVTSAFAANTAKSPFDLEIPPPEKRFVPVLKTLPGSLPEYQKIKEDAVVQQQGFDTTGLYPIVSKLVPTVVISAFTTSGELDEIGTLLESEGEAGLPVDGQYVFVKMHKGEAQLLDKILIVADRGPLKKVFSDDDVKMKGNLIQIRAEAQLSSIVQPSESDSSHDYFRARITRAIDLSQSGNKIIKGQLRSVMLTPSGPRNNISAEIIGGEAEERSGLYGPGTFVFINKGSGDGVKPGDILSVFVNRKIRKRNTPIYESGTSEGLLKVVEVNTEVSSAVVVQASAGIRQGDRTGSLAVNDVEPDQAADPEEDFELTE